MSKEQRTPEQIIADLAPEYKSWKGSEKAKEKLKKEFFKAITEHIKENEEQAEKVVEITASNEEDARTAAEKAYPLWLVDDLRPSPDTEGAYDVIIVENPEFQTYTIEYNDEVWGRQIVAGSTMIDDDQIQEDDPVFYQSISEYAGEGMIREIIAFAIDEDDPHSQPVYEILEQFCEQKKEGRRVLRPLEDLDAEQLAKVQPYMYETKPSVRFPAPTKVDG